ncbi:YibE/F family protein [Clostridium sp. DJ247]|uniref:YibE/F family protein n=1 Tax=Clostridium sp. DJ247 TaxID=2726188 RepID=UPI001626CDED|nr:YibE/F family protein [Clostridium sp. DJ247]MBC2582191.1 YibE/F family protein [Clostridium sp. DJ247]
MVKAAEGQKTNSSSILQSQVDSDVDPVHGKVIKVYADEIKTDKSAERYTNVDVKILSGKLKGKTLTVQNFVNGRINDEKSNTQGFARLGDEVLISIDEDSSGNIKSAYIYEIVRYKYLYKLGGVFAILLMVVGGKKGVKSVITLGITGFAVIKILIPLIIQGFSPTIVSAIICIFVIIVSLLIISGKNEKTLAAIIGTAGGVLIAGAIAIFSNSIIRVNGLTDDEIQSIIYTTQNSNFDFTGLLFAGIIMGALGAVMDVSMSIASSMKEIREARPDITKKELIKSGMNVGKDIMGTMANTLILAYAGGSMYIMIMIDSYTTSMSTAINQDIIAAEILKALAGSIGLIFAIPITAIVAAILSTNEKPNIETDKVLTEDNS